MELVSDPDGVKVDLYTEQGSVRERALAPVVLGIPLDELDVALQAVPNLFAPLRMRHHKGKLVFTQRDIAATLPPPEIEVSSDSLISKAAQPAFGPGRMATRPSGFRRTRRRPTASSSAGPFALAHTQHPR
jgi:hypothetical protein